MCLTVTETNVFKVVLMSLSLLVGEVEVVANRFDGEGDGVADQELIAISDRDVFDGFVAF